MSKINNDEIVRLAKLQRIIDEHSSLGAGNDYQRQLSVLSIEDLVLVDVAANLMEGKPRTIYSDASELVDRAKSLAKHLGASVSSRIEVVGGRVEVVLTPRSRQ